MNRDDCFPISYHVWYLGFKGKSQTYNHQTLYVGEDESEARERLNTQLPDDLQGVTWFIETWAFGYILNKEIITNNDQSV